VKAEGPFSSKAVFFEFIFKVTGGGNFIFLVDTAQLVDIYGIYYIRIQLDVQFGIQ